MPNTIPHKNNARFAELDGLRALAVTAVILFHCDITDVFNAGFFGVDVFFTISGFIITAMLLREYRSDGSFDFSNFYFRRIKRLQPPVLGLIAIAFVGTWIISKLALQKFVADAPAGLVFLSNWWQIVDKQDYFDTTPHVLRHLWSLAVEEQFYFVWPPVMYLILKWGGPKVAGGLALLGAVASTAWMWYLYLLNADAIDQHRIYLGTDTHAMGLLIGAALACFWNPYQPREPGRWARLGWRSAALAALVLLGAMAITMNTSHPWLYRGAFLLVSVLTCIVIFTVMADPAFIVSAILRTRPVQWIGSRSYSLYLVHWLVFVWMRLLDHGNFADWRVLVSGLAVVMIASELMYRCVEMPAKAFDLKKPATRPKVAAVLAYVIIATSFSVAITWAGSGAWDKPSGTPELASAPAAVEPAPAAPAQATAPVDNVNAAVANDDPADANIRISGGADIYALGDSVLLGARDHITKYIPGIQIDAAVGRQASQGLKIAKQWHGKLGKSSTVLVHLGTNGYINEGQFKELLQELAECKSVILINVHADRRWTAPNNEIIARMTHEYPNVHLVDWNSMSSGRPDFFVKDGIHLTRRGILAFTSQIKIATGGEPLPQLQPADVPAAARTRRVAARAAKAAEQASTPDAGPQAMKVPAGAPAPSVASDTPAPDHGDARPSGAAGLNPSTTPASDAQVE
jgi:peptidoglycan/LPS O-acetylase OafA/YrhL